MINKYSLSLLHNSVRPLFKQVESSVKIRSEGCNYVYYLEAQNTLCNQNDIVLNDIHDKYDCM